jgi:hypothetical protein
MDKLKNKRIDISKQVYKNYSDKVIKNSVGEDELSLPFNKKSFILHREV